MFQNDGIPTERVQVLARRLSEATGLLFRAGTEGRSTAVNSLEVEIQLEDGTIELLYSLDCIEEGPLTTRLLQALAREIYDGLAGSQDQDVPFEAWTWEKLLNEALAEQWDHETFAAKAAACRLTGLSLGYPVLVHCSSWTPEVVEVLENLFPQAPVHWVLKPDIFLYVPLERSEGLAEHRLY